MKLFDVLCNTRYKLLQGGNAEVKSLTLDSRRVSRGSMFFCIKGLRNDGHAFVRDAIEQHAAVIVAEHEITAPPSLAVVRVSDVREALAHAAANFYGRPAEALTLIGVTGTNGKTSTTYFMESVLNAYAKKTGIIGTVEFRIGSERLNVHTPTSTTPDTIELHQILNKMREEAVDCAVMEVSSHGLALRKTDGLKYKVGIFTNLTQDHLDFHGGMEAYRDAKARLFAACEHSVINADDPYAEYMLAAAGKALTYGINSNCDLRAENVRLTESGCGFSLNINGVREQFSIPVRGRFSVYNSLGVIGAALCMNIPVKIIKSGLEGFGGVPGRIQSVKNDRGFDVVVDYAHTPDGLKNIISAVREVTGGRIITVFGCGGDRDKNKRPQMGRIAGELSDCCVITSDNPRTENPDAILDEIERGLIETGCAYEKICDRQSAIDRAVELARPGDSVIIAGKGHENYQIFSDRTIHFDDREAAEAALERTQAIRMTLGEIARAVGGECNSPDTIIRGISTDTRCLTRGNLFVALKGDNFDGHDYIRRAFEMGAAACLSERDAYGAIVRVDSTAKALRELAEHHRRKFRLPVVAITGSSGKTTTKDMVSSVLSQKYKTLRTEGNFNNEIGLPLTALTLTAEHQCAVFEMGMNSFGEISNLSKIARPDICVITNIGMAHIESLGSREGILRAKTEIFDYMNPEGCVILNGEDELLAGLTSPPGRIYYGFSRMHDLYADNVRFNGLDSISATLHYADYSFEITVPQPGEHMLIDALAATAVGLRLGLSLSQITQGLAAFTPSKNRMDIFKSPWGPTVINDCYNANPASMRAAIDVLARQPGTKACILGDMLELGEFSETEHADLGRYAVSKGIDIIIFVGQLSHSAYREARKRKTGTLLHFYDKTKMLLHLRETFADNPTVLIKASRAMRLEEIVEKFKEAEHGTEFS